MENPSRHHPNRRYYNWLAYDMLDSELSQCSQYISGSLLDVGAGDQVYKDFFKNYCADYKALDWSSSHHRTRPDIVADLSQGLEIESESYDTVVMLSVLEHLYDPAFTLVEMSRILRKGGVLILQLPWMWRTHEEPFDFYRLSHFAIRRLLVEAGLEILVDKPLGNIFTTIALKTTYFLSRMVRQDTIPIKSYPLRICCWLAQSIARRIGYLDIDPYAEATGYFYIARKVSMLS